MSKICRWMKIGVRLDSPDFNCRHKLGLDQDFNYIDPIPDRSSWADFANQCLHPPELPIIVWWMNATTLRKAMVRLRNTHCPVARKWHDLLVREATERHDADSSSETFSIGHNNYRWFGACRGPRR